MNSSSDLLVLRRPKSNPYASLIARRRPAPAPADNDLTVRLSIWERGPRQTNSDLAILIRLVLQRIHENTEVANPWTVNALPQYIHTVGKWPQPIQVDISCKSIDVLPSESPSLEDGSERRKDLVGWLFKELQAYTSNQDCVKSIYSDRLIGFALNYPAIPNGETSYVRLEVQKLHLPKIEEWEKARTESVRTKFYRGYLLTLDRVSKVLKAYKEMTQEIPNGPFPNEYANIGLAAAKKVAVVLPDLMEKDRLLEDMNRFTVDELIHRYTPPVIRCMEEVLDALENIAMDTRSREPCPRQTCDVISKIYQLKRKTPALTAVLELLKDMKAQQKHIWGAAAVGAVGASALALAAPVVVAPVAAFVGSAMGSTAAAGTASTAVVGTSVGIAGGTLAVAKTGALTATGAALSSKVVFGFMAGAVIGAGSFKAFIQFLEDMESHSTMTINKQVNKDLEMIVYYIALCFMKSNGIANPLSDDGQVTKIVGNLYGERPIHIAKKQYRAHFLHFLVRNLADEFRKVVAGLKKLGYTRLEDLKWTAKPLITMEDSTMSF